MMIDTLPDASTSVNMFGMSMCCPPVLTGPIGEDDATELADLLKALADPARLRLVSLIAASPAGEVCACDLAEPLGRSQPTVSHHLGQLVKAGVLRREQRGRWAWFSVDTDRLAAICGALWPAGEAQVNSLNIG